MAETSKADWEALEKKLASKKEKSCTYCGWPGHNIRTCPEYLKEKTFY